MVEHSLGKGEVESSILSRSTIRTSGLGPDIDIVRGRPPHTGAGRFPGPVPSPAPDGQASLPGILTTGRFGMNRPHEDAALGGDILDLKMDGQAIHLEKKNQSGQINSSHFIERNT